MTIPDGGSIRKLARGEAAIFREHLLRLDSESRRSRFGGGVADDHIRAYVDGAEAQGVVFGFFARGVLRGAAELRRRSAGAAEAEVALSIEKPWQSHGVGAALLERVLLAARNRGYTLLHMDCLAENHAMRQLARKFGAALSVRCGSAVAEMEAPVPTPFSLMREMVADASDAAIAALERAGPRRSAA